MMPSAGQKHWADILIDEGVEDLDELCRRIRATKGLSPQLRELVITSVVQQCRPLTVHEISRRKEMVIADMVTMWITVSRGAYKTEAAVAQAAQATGLSRSRIFQILRDRKSYTEDFRREIEAVLPPAPAP